MEIATKQPLFAVMSEKEGENVLILITYDVNTETAAGRRRLRKVAKECVNYGQRVQNSVFECVADAAKGREIKEKLANIIDEKTDSLRLP